MVLGVSLCGIGNQSVWYWESVCVILGISRCDIGNQSVWYFFFPLVDRILFSLTCSHLLQRQGKVSQAVDDLYGTAKFSRE